MPFEEVNRAEIERRRDRLFDEYGEAPVVEWRKDVDPDEFDEWIEMSRDGYVGSAYALVRRPPEKLPNLTESMDVYREERERVLLIQGRGGSYWGVPGGGQEGDETYEENVHREIREEVGIEVSLTGLNHVRHETATCEGYDERLHVLRVFFQAEYEGGSVSIQPGELNGATWFAVPPARERLMPATKRLIEEWNPPHDTSRDFDEWAPPYDPDVED